MAITNRSKIFIFLIFICIACGRLIHRAYGIKEFYDNVYETSITRLFDYHYSDRKDTIKKFPGYVPFPLKISKTVYLKYSNKFIYASVLKKARSEFPNCKFKFKVYINKNEQAIFDSFNKAKIPNTEILTKKQNCNSNIIEIECYQIDSCKSNP